LPVLFWFLFPERGQASGAYSFPEALPAGAFTTRFFLAHGQGRAPRWHGLSVTLSLYARLQRITSKVVCRYCINRYFRYIFAIACGDRMISK
jgi:hypothetical protein